MCKAKGFTLLELLVVIVIIGLLAGYVAPRYFGQVGKSEVQVARAQLDSLEKALDQFRLDNRHYPTAEQGLDALVNKPAGEAAWAGPYLKKALLDAGLNLVEALQTLAEKEPEGERQQVLSGMVAAINRGEPFSQAVAAFPQHFSPLYVATIKASERTGNVKEALGRYIAYQDELDRVKKKVVSASIYPAILMVVGTLVIGFLMLYVVPRFAQVYEDMAHTLPFFSQLLLSFGSFVGKHGFFMFSVFILGIGAGAWALFRPAVRAALNRRIWALPALGSRMKTYQLARLYRTAGNIK